jgi:hypothetical protein
VRRKIKRKKNGRPEKGGGGKNEIQQKGQKGDYKVGSRI